MTNTLRAVRVLGGSSGGRLFSASSASDGLMLFASEYASCLGFNRYQGPHKALDSVWRRHAPEVYLEAVRRLEGQGHVMVSEEAALEAAISSQGVDALVEGVLQRGDVAASAPEVMALRAEAAATVAMSVSEALKERAGRALEGSSLQPAAREELERAIASEVDVGKKMEAAKELLKDDPVASGEVARALEAEKASQEAVVEHVERELFTRYGTRSENPAIRQYEELTGHEVLSSNKFHHRSLGRFGGLEVAVGGRVDGIMCVPGPGGEEEVRVIEVKNRTRRLFFQLPIYERVQTQAYLYILKLRAGEVVECLRGRGAGAASTEINTVPFTWDEEFWETVLIPRAGTFVASYSSLLVRRPAVLVRGRAHSQDTPERQDAFLLAGEQEKEALMKQWGLPTYS